MKVSSSILFTAMMLTASCIADGGAEPAEEYITEGMSVPAFTVEGNAGEVFRSPEDFTGKTTLLVFFATWCPDCQAELPEINKAWETLKENEKYAVAAISRGGASGEYEQNEDIVADYWSANSLSMPWYMDSDRKVFGMFASANIPRMYIVDGGGTVVWRAVAPEMKAEEYINLLKRY